MLLNLREDVSVNTTALKVIAKYKAYSQTDVAKAAGVSKQAVSRWFKRQEDVAEVRSTHLARLAENLHISVAMLLKPIPGWRESEKALTAEQNPSTIIGLLI